MNRKTPRNLPYLYARCPWHLVETPALVQPDEAHLELGSAHTLGGSATAKFLDEIEQEETLLSGEFLQELFPDPGEVLVPEITP